DLGELACTDRVAEHDNRMRGTLPGLRERIVTDRLTDPHLYLHRHGRHRLFDRLLQALRVRIGADQHAQHEPPTNHDLLDVQHVDTVPGQHCEQCGGDTGFVTTGGGDQHRGTHAFSWVST